MENKNMYSGGYALCIIGNGKVLPELADGSILCPFGQEYKIRLHNKNNKRAMVRIWIDGEEITRTNDADGLLVGANTFIDLERPLDTAVRFKFVSRDTQEAWEAGKDGPDPRREMGVIRVEFTEEADLPQPTNWPVAPPHQRKDWYLGPDTLGRGGNQKLHRQLNWAGGQHCNDSRHRRIQASGGQSMSFMAASSLSANYEEKTAGIDLSGCTVEGGYSSQKFQSTSFKSSHKPATVLQVVLKGATENQVQSTSSSLKKGHRDRLRREEISALEAQMTAMQLTLDRLKNS